MRGFEACPVCLRMVSVSQHRDVIRHQDKAGQPCPMSGVFYPRTDFEVAS